MALKKMLVFLLCLHTGRVADSLNADYATWSIPYGVASRAMSNNTHNSIFSRSCCYKELGLFAKALMEKRRWAVLAHDSSGMPTPGLEWRGTFWLGSKKQCLIHQSSFKIPTMPTVSPNDTNTKPPFDFAYFVVYAQHNSTIQQRIEWWREDIITIGLCLPASCTLDQLHPILTEYFSSFSLGAQQLYDIGLKVFELKATNPDESFAQSLSYKIFKYTCIIIVFLTLIGTIYDELFSGNGKSSKETKSIKKIQHTDINGNMNGGTKITESRKHFVDKNENEKSAEYAKIKEYEDILQLQQGLQRHENIENSKLEDFLSSFNLLKNFYKTFDLNADKDMLLPLNGWRSINMITLIILHAVLYTNDKNENIVSFYYQMPYRPHYLRHTFINGHLIVDSFLCLGGFLLARTFFKNNDIRNIKYKPSLQKCIKDFSRGIWKRYIRLTPPYMFTIIFSAFIYNFHYPESIIAISENVGEQCSNYWWTNLLYINNMYPSMFGKCLSWSYYLSNDMQFYIIGSALLYLAIFQVRMSTILGVTIISSSSLYTAYKAYTTSYYSVTHIIMATLDTFYTPPWMRIGPYLIGISGAYFMHYHKILLDNRIIRLIGWMSTLCGGSFAIYGSIDISSKSLLYSAFHTAIYRQLWALLTIWFFVMVLTDNIWSPIIKLISLKVWIPISKLSYCAYLLNVMIIYQGILVSEKALYRDDHGMVITGLGYVCLTYAVSFFVYIFTELPFNNMITNNRTKKEKCQMNDNNSEKTNGHLEIRNEKKLN